MYKISIGSEVCDIWGLVNYLCKCIGQGRIHSSSSLSVKNTSFNSNYWLHGWSILDPKEDNGSIHWSHCIEKILTLFPIIQDKIIKIRRQIGELLEYEISYSLVYYSYCNLRFGAKVPEHCSEHQSYDGCEEQSHSSIGRIAPVWPALLPQASHTLCEKWLWVLWRKIQVLWIWCRRAQFLNHCFVAPEIHDTLQ